MTVRLRLTALFGGLFALTGAVLLAVNYELVKRNLPVSDVLLAPLPGFPTQPVPGSPLGPFPGARVFIDGRPAEEVITELPGRLRDDALDSLLRQSLIALAALGVASVGLGWVVAGRVLRPIGDITAAARRLSERNLHERIAMEGPADELKELADTFDGMLGRLDAAFDSQRRFVANASHQLRTPLAIMRAEVDVTMADPDATPAQLRAMGATVGEAVQRSERLIDALLVLARGERGVPGAERADLAGAAELALAQVAAEAERLGLRVQSTLGPAPVRGDGALLEQLAANLVDNAVRYNRPGGWAHLTTGRVGGRSFLRVANSGPLVRAEDVDALFEPFRRLAGDRAGGPRGTGLGLSIARAVATAHGGEVTARPYAEGGMEVTVELPWADA